MPKSPEVPKVQSDYKSCTSEAMHDVCVTTTLVECYGSYHI